MGIGLGDMVLRNGSFSITSHIQSQDKCIQRDELLKVKRAMIGTYFGS